MQILALACDIPFPPIGGGKLRTFHLLRALAQRHEVTLVGFSFGAPLEPPPYRLRVVPVEWTPPLLYRQMWGSDPVACQAATEQLQHHSSEPWFVSYYDVPAMEAAVRDVAHEGFDLVLLCGSAMGRFLPALPAAVPKVLNFYDVHSLMAERTAEPHEVSRTLAFERAIAAQCEVLLTCSEVEARYARQKFAHPRVEVVPNGVDTASFNPTYATAEPGNVVFTGLMSYAPNADAVQYFVREIWPAIRAAVPTAKFHVVGANPGRDVQLLASDSVIIHGTVPDVRPFLQQAAVVVVPLRYGGGTRLKILEAAAAGRAIVSTTLGAEGLDFRHEHDIILADEPAAFAGAVIALLNDPGRAARLGAAACETVRRYDWTVIGDRFVQLMEWL